MVVDRTFRFHAPEQDILKQRLSVPPGPFAGGARPWAPLGPGELSVRCSDPDVAVGVTHSTELGMRHKEELFLKFKLPPAPDARQFFVTLYKDRFQAHLAETWQVFVHARRRVDMSALVGQTAHTSVVLRGLPTSRRVLCFCSHPDELTVAPAEPFVLPAHSLTEVQLSFRPLVAGRIEARAERESERANVSASHCLLVFTLFPPLFLVSCSTCTRVFISPQTLLRGRLADSTSSCPTDIRTRIRYQVLVHVVDADTRELVHPLLVCTDARAPTVSKTFEVEVPRGLQARFASQRARGVGRRV